MHHRMWALLALLLALSVAACGSDSGDGASGGGDRPGEGKPPVRLGTKNFTEQFILGELYAQALRAKGWDVDLKRDIGSAEVIDKALTSGRIDGYAEYTGTTLSVLKGQRDVPRTAGETYRQAKAFYEGRGQTLLERTPFEDRDALAVTKAFARRHGGLDSTADLKGLGMVRLGAAPEFRTRFAGLQGLRSEYGLTNLRFKALPIDAIFDALDRGTIQAADVFTTDPRLATGKYVVLDDPKAIFGFQNVAPVVSQEVLDKQGPAFSQTLNAVSATLTTEVMQQLNDQVAVDGRAPEDVARDYLKAQNLL
jgi:osmoprotectant transport system substrate-binding protein